MDKSLVLKCLIVYFIYTIIGYTILFFYIKHYDKDSSNKGLATQHRFAKAFCTLFYHNSKIEEVDWKVKVEGIILYFMIYSTYPAYLLFFIISWIIELIKIIRKNK